MLKEINPDKLRGQLIETYAEFSKDRDSERGIALAKDLDGDLVRRFSFRRRYSIGS